MPAKSLFNDGAGYVVFLLLIGLALGWSVFQVMRRMIREEIFALIFDREYT
ncbi:hypothetical protein LAZ40_02165 [Cereibacter sphaeroides]|uniref:hypothetical protein n=1 Tax=Cereibacter sphaeroides TaxID=1063 RepID=UPI001F1EF0B0|nr:hypothetical protein [Cereibacter sphaeroides]MCE6957862.1 hypothetical protein [Cereibacter sphaeroides]MCE6971831.1 hypothetical protein [Cereibacter sphaeroides]